MLLLANLLADDGRPFYNEDLDMLQNQMLDAATATFAALGSFIVSGCVLTPGVEPDTFNIGPGLVWLDRLHQFPGAEGVAMPGWIGIGAAVTSSPRLFETGEQKDAFVEFRASWDLVATPGAIAFTAENPGLRYWQVAAAQSRTIGDIAWLGVYDPAQYDETGKGIGAARGWAVCNGENGTVPLNGRLPLAQNLTASLGLSERLVGQTGGVEEVVLTEAQIPDLSIRLYESADDAGFNPNGFPGQGGNTSRQAAINANEYSDTAVETRNTQGQAHPNMPPFCVLFARQWIGLYL